MTSSGEIFIVDDDPALRDALLVAFSLGGYHVSGFADGNSFLATARAAAIVYHPGCSNAGPIGPRHS
jgi:FixJ family two-component response regulator